MENKLVNEEEKQSQNENDVVAMAEPPEQTPENKKKKKIIISVVIALVLIIIISIILVFTIKRGGEIKPYLVYNATSGNHTHTIIFMPGYSNQPEDYKNQFENKIKFTKKPDTTIVILRSPKRNITFNKSVNFAWYDIIKTPLSNFSDLDLDGLKNSAKVLENYIDNEANVLNGDYGKIIIGGHSQGASIALYQAYTGKHLLGGVYAFSGFLPPGNVTEDKRKLNAYLGFGDADDVILPSFINQTIERIKGFEGFNLYIYKNHKHHVCTNQTKDASKFLDRIIK
jgi:phospholipase/carboxylesterase